MSYARKKHISAKSVNKAAAQNSGNAFSASVAQKYAKNKPAKIQTNKYQNIVKNFRKPLGDKHRKKRKRVAENVIVQRCGNIGAVAYRQAEHRNFKIAAQKARKDLTQIFSVIRKRIDVLIHSVVPPHKTLARRRVNCDNNRRKGKKAERVCGIHTSALFFFYQRDSVHTIYPIKYFSYSSLSKRQKPSALLKEPKFSISPTGFRPSEQ